jgi:hypothetical protein
MSCMNDLAERGRLEASRRGLPKAECRYLRRSRLVCLRPKSPRIYVKVTDETNGIEDKDKSRNNGVRWCEFGADWLFVVDTPYCGGLSTSKSEKVAPTSAVRRLNTTTVISPALGAGREGCCRVRRTIRLALVMIRWHYRQAVHEARTQSLKV